MKFVAVALPGAILGVALWMAPSGACATSAWSPAPSAKTLAVENSASQIILAKDHHDNDENGDDDNDDGGEGHGKGHDHGHGHHHKDHHKHGHHDDYNNWVKSQNYQGSYFTPSHAAFFNNYYGTANWKNLPPGLRNQLDKNGALPEGLERQLQRNGKLPPGLESRLIPVEPTLASQLSTLPPNTKLYTLGHDAVLLDQNTRSIVDILHNAY